MNGEKHLEDPKPWPDRTNRLFGLMAITERDLENEHIGICGLLQERMDAENNIQVTDVGWTSFVVATPFNRSFRISVEMIEDRNPSLGKEKP